MTTINRPVAGQIRRSFGVTPIWAAAFLLFHVPLGLAMGAYPVVATIHGLFVFALGLTWAVAGYEDRVATWGGYVAVCDVLWRMTKASVPWEFAKYALVLVLVVSVVRSGRVRGSVLPFVYMGLLLPSSLFVLWNLRWSVAVREISFNLSGPLALALSVWFFSRVTLNASTYAAVLIAMTAPAISVSSLVLSGILSTAEFDFQQASNFATSGGYGPNQVASVLGLGALVFFFLLVATRGAGWLRVLFFFLMVGLASQSALTFSRGGVLTAAGAAMATLLFLLPNRAARRRVVVVGGMAVAVMLLLILPRLASFTEGALGARFETLDTTGRAEMAMADLLTWRENPVLGVGPGMAVANRRAVVGAALVAHTEWTRLVAEHGVLGFGAAVCLILMALKAVAGDRRPLERALAAGFAVWACLFMFQAGMRLAAPAFAMGLVQCRTGKPATLLKGERE